MKRPAFTRRALEGLQAVAADARAMVEERAGCNDKSLTRHDKLVQRGLDYIEELTRWSAQQREMQKVKKVARGLHRAAARAGK